MKSNGSVPRKWSFILRQSFLHTLDFTTLKSMSDSKELTWVYTTN